MNQRINQRGQLKIQRTDTLHVMRREPNLQKAVAGGDMGVVIELFGEVSDLRQAGHDMLKTVKGPGFHETGL